MTVRAKPNLRAALESEMKTVSDTAGRDIGDDPAAALLLCYVANGKVNVIYGGARSAEFLEKVAEWVGPAARALRAEELPLLGLLGKQPVGNA